MSNILTQIEKDSIRQMLEKATPNETVLLDLSDPVQYSFFMAQLKQAKLTSENRPNMFKSIENLRSQQEKYKKFKKSLAMLLAESNEVSSTTVNAIAYMSTNNGKDYSSSSVSSVYDGATYSSVTIGFYDKNGNPVSEVKKNEQFNKGIYNDITMSNTKVTTEQQVYAVASYYYEKDRKSYASFQSATNLFPWPNTIEMDSPITKDPNTSIIKFCMNRKNDDCDYYYKDTEGTVDFPFQGQITFDSAIDLDSAGKPLNASCSIQFIAVKQGGTAIDAADYDFFKDPNTVINGNVISWNIPMLQFKDTKIHSGDGEEVQFLFSLTLSTSGNIYTSYITNKPNQEFSKPGVLKIKSMQVVNGCLARGTKVLMADEGSTEKCIEEIKVGEMVKGPNGKAYKVINYYIGFENTIIRMKDSLGHSLDLTHKHPVLTFSGIKQAEVLTVGDKISTTDGEALISEIEEILYDNKVYNLELEAGEHIHYANGIPVGDSIVQTDFENEFLQDESYVMELLPEEWLKDYQNYLSEIKA